MRAKVGMALFVGILMAQVVFIAEKRRVRELEPVDLIPGTTVENVRLSVHENQGLVAGAGDLWDVIGDRCMILIFFQSSCPYCKRVADEWRGVSEVEYEGVTVPVKWTSVMDSDLGAAQFVTQFDLPLPWFSMRGREDRMALGIVAWPKLYLLAPDGVFAGELPRDLPAEGTAPPNRCASS